MTLVGNTNAIGDTALDLLTQTMIERNVDSGTVGARKERATKTAVASADAATKVSLLKNLEGANIVTWTANIVMWTLLRRKRCTKS